MYDERFPNVPVPGGTGRKAPGAPTRRTEANVIDIKWDSKFEIGHPRIDAEHRAFVDLIRAVSLEAERDCPKEKAMRLLLEVRKYAEFHFVSEENIMLDIGYPDYAEHREEHAWLLRRLEDEAHSYYTDSAPLEELAHFMFNWFALHTTTVDKKLVASIAAHEAAAKT